MSEARAWGWVAALRDGSTTPWAAWSAEADRTGRFLPGAQQLEVLRRLNVVQAARGRRTPAGLVERVLTASAPGRGRPDLELVGAVPPADYGPQPVDPADLPADELLRVVTNLLAEDLVAAGVPPRLGQRPRWRRPGLPYRVGGTPWIADAVREEMVRRGREPGGRGAVVHLLGADVATMVEHAFVARSFAEGGGSWAGWLARTSNGLPPRADLVRAARWWDERVSRSRLDLVLDHRLLPRLLGTRRALPEPAVPSADGTDLARRTAEPLGLLVLPDTQADLLRRTLLPRLLAHPGPPVRLDAERLEWARETADRMARRIDAAGYAVHGSTDLLVPPRAAGEGTAPDVDRVLGLGLALLLEDVEHVEEGR